MIRDAAACCGPNLKQHHRHLRESKIAKLKTTRPGQVLSLLIGHRNRPDVGRSALHEMDLVI
jgi:hypothetical protein